MKKMDLSKKTRRNVTVMTSTTANTNNQNNEEEITMKKSAFTAAATENTAASTFTATTWGIIAQRAMHNLGILVPGEKRSFEKRCIVGVDKETGASIVEWFVALDETEYGEYNGCHLAVETYVGDEIVHVDVCDEKYFREAEELDKQYADRYAIFERSLIVGVDYVGNIITENFRGCEPTPDGKYYGDSLQCETYLGDCIDDVDTVDAKAYARACKRDAEMRSMQPKAFETKLVIGETADGKQITEHFIALEETRFGEYNGCHLAVEVEEDGELVSVDVEDERYFREAIEMEQKFTSIL